MRRLSAFTLGAMLCVAGLAAPPLIAQEQSQESVADAARKTREQKKTAKKEGKVYTNDDLAAPPRSLTPEVQVTGQPAQSGAAAEGQKDKGPAAKGATAPAEDKKDETYWRQRFKDARDALARAEKELDILQREFAQGQVQYYSDPTKAMNEQLKRTEVNDKQAKINEKKKEIAALRQKLDDMEVELKRAGGDIGWSR